MKLVQSHDVSDRLRSLFSPGAPAALRCFTVLDGANRGTIWANDLENPAWAIVQEAAFGTLYLEGQFPDGLLVDFTHERQQQGEVLYGFWADADTYENQFPPPRYNGHVWESDQRSSAVDLPSLFTALPDDCVIRPIDATLFERIQDYQFYSDVFGSPEQALQQGFGFCLMRADDILCEVFAGISHQGLIEIGVNTREGHRQKGYGTATCAQVIHEAEKRGYRTYWNCAVQNVASTTLAHRLGYAPMRKYRLLGWW